MNPPAANPLYNVALELWLATATRGLCPEAAERVTREISEHYEQGVETALADGIDQIAAHAAALAALGSAGKARTRFNRAFLTKGEEEMVKILNGKTPFIEVPQPCWPLDWGIYVGVATYTLMGQYFMVVLFAPYSWGRLVRYFMRDRPQSEVWRMIALIQVLFIPLACLKLTYQTLASNAAAMSTGEIAIRVLGLFMMLLWPIIALRIAAKLPKDKGTVQS